MNQGTYPLAAAMINQINRVDVISNNLANANTNGFKQDGFSEGSFNNYLKKAEEKNIQPLKTSEVFNTIPKIDTHYFNEMKGPTVQTTNEFDFSLHKGNTFFKVRNENGETLLTRDGSFHSINNFLVDNSGQKILDINNEPIPAVEGFEQLIGVVKSDFKNLEKIGSNNYRIIDDSEIEEVVDNIANIAQGTLEASNVNAVQTMVSLIDAHRRFAQSQKAIEAIGEISKTAIDKIGKA
jgi:flagellar basal-body rod protein FlgG